MALIIMITTNALNEAVRHAIELAVRAPSVHNTQPWRFDVSEKSIDLSADERCWLRVADPDKRDLVVSCGAALHHLRVALAAAGIGATTRRLPDPARPDLLASVLLDDGVDRVDAAMVEQIPRRRSDRRAFHNWPLPDAFRQRLFDRAAGEGVLLVNVDDAGLRTVISRAAAVAAEAQWNKPGYAEELTAWTDHTDTQGIPTENLVRPAPPAAVVAREFGRPAAAVNNIDPEQAMLVVLGTTSDDSLSWLRAGEAMSSVLLEATRQGLGSCPVSQAIEVESSRAMVADQVLGGSLCPQMVLRIGWATDAPLPATPRRPVTETITGMI